jgi:hypothetical protein
LLRQQLVLLAPFQVLALDALKLVVHLQSLILEPSAVLLTIHWHDSGRFGWR